MVYTVGEMAKLLGVTAPTLRYYDKEGLLPNIERSSGIRKFSDRDLETLNVIECLKKSGLEIKDIRQFIQWCAEGNGTYSKRLELFIKQKENVEKEMKRLEKTRAMLQFQCWYYEQAIEDGNEDNLKKMLPDKLPPEIQKIYDFAHE